MSASGPDETDEFLSDEELASRFFLPSPPPVRVDFGAASHPGLVRANNEDHFLVLRSRRSVEIVLTNLPEDQPHPADAAEDAYFLVVADGMGGAAFGELASMQAIRTGIDLLLRDTKWTMKFNERELKEMMQKVGVYFRLIDRALIARAKADPRLTGMGTTLTVAYTVGPEAFILHAGDSRAYLFRAGRLEQLTCDHTLAQQLVDTGAASPDSFEVRSLGHVLTNCLGGPGQGVWTEIQYVHLHDGDRLLLCTDGLTDLVDDPEIAEVLRDHPEPDAACRALIAGALAQGGRDNVTVIIGRYAMPPAAPAA